MILLFVVPGHAGSGALAPRGGQRSHLLETMQHYHEPAQVTLEHPVTS